MSTTSRVMKASPGKVWSVLADGWLYPLWVVGATRMRDVDDAWPEPGSRLHHSIGVWPLTIDDHTESLAAEEERRLELRARGWPAGEAQVVLHLAPRDGGSSTQVVLEEWATSGPGQLVPDAVEQTLLGWRNAESLLRLSFLAERRGQ